MEKLTIKWALASDAIIKFVEKEEVFDLDANFTEEKLKQLGADVSGSVFNVTIDAKKGEHGTVTGLDKVGAAQAAPKTVTAPASNTITGKTIEGQTVKAISSKTDGITFIEQENVWYTVKMNDLKTANIEKGSVVSFTFEANPVPGKNLIITSIKKADVKKEDSKQQAMQPTTNTNQSEKKYMNKGSDTQVSIEAQAAVNRAYALAGDFFGKAPLETLIARDNDIKVFIKNHAEFSYGLMQELKSK